MTDERPEFSHQRERHGLVGPFSGRQLLAAFVAIVVAVVVLVGITTPLGTTGGNLLTDPRATPFLIGTPTEGLQPGSLAPELTIALPDGGTFQLTDLDGHPIRLADLRGKVVWLNFWASWCPPCQHETPILRDLSERYRDRGLEIIGISVQETTPADIAAYAERYQLHYTIGFDTSGHVFHTYKVYALPTQFFIDTQGVIRQVVNGPVDEAGAAALIESMLPPCPSRCRVPPRRSRSRSMSSGRAVVVDSVSGSNQPGREARSPIDALHPDDLPGARPRRGLGTEHGGREAARDRPGHRLAPGARDRRSDRGRRGARVARLGQDGPALGRHRWAVHRDQGVAGRVRHTVPDEAAALEVAAGWPGLDWPGDAVEVRPVGDTRLRQPADRGAAARTRVSVK